MLRRRWGFASQLATIGVLALGVRLAFAIYQRRRLPFPFSDATKYAALANGIADGQWFLHPFNNLAPTADHSPLYVLYLVPVAVVRNAAASEFDFIVWSCFLGAASVILIGLCGREIAGPRVGLIAAGIAAVDPGMWVHDGVLLSESMAIFATTGLILLSYRLWRSPSLWNAVWLGLWCGVATLSRSELALAVPFLLLPLTVRAKGYEWRTRIQWLVAGGLVAALVISPWVIFNRGRFEEPVYLTTNFGRTMAAAKCFEGYHGRLLGAQSYDCLDRIKDEQITPEMDESEADDVYRAEAVRYAKAHPGRTAVQVTAAWGRLFGVYRPTQELDFQYTRQTKGIVVGWLVVLSFSVLIISSIFGAIVLRRRQVPVYPLLVFWAMVLISVALTFSQYRYRAIGQPTLVLLTAVTLDEMLRRRRSEPDAPSTSSPGVEAPGASSH